MVSRLTPNWRASSSCSILARGNASIASVSPVRTSRLHSCRRRMVKSITGREQCSQPAARSHTSSPLGNLRSDGARHPVQRFPQPLTARGYSLIASAACTCSPQSPYRPMTLRVRAGVRVGSDRASVSMTTCSWTNPACASYFVAAAVTNRKHRRASAQAKRAERAGKYGPGRNRGALPLSYRSRSAECT